MTAKNASLEVRAREFWIDHCRDLWTLGRYKDEKGEPVTRTMDERIASLTALLTAVASEAVAGEREKVRVMAIALADDTDDAPGGMVCCLCGDGRDFGDDEEAATANIGTCPHSENCPLRTGSPS